MWPSRADLPWKRTPSFAGIAGSCCRSSPASRSIPLFLTPRFGTCKDEVRQRDGRSYGWEPVVFLWKPGPRPMYPYGRKEPLDFFVADWKAHLGNKLAGQHPCPRPVDVLEAIIDNYTLPNALILDPMAGSGIYLRGSGSHWTKISRNRTQRSVRSLGTKTVESRSLNAPCAGLRIQPKRRRKEG